MSSRLTRWDIGLGALTLVGLLTVSADRAPQRSDPTLQEVVQRLAALEERVSKLEQQIAALTPARTSAPASGVAAPIVEITSPKDGAEVGMQPTVQGLIHVANLTARQPVILVHPLRSSLLFVQALPLQPQRTGDGHYRFQARVFLGSREAGLGEQFEIYVLLAKEGAFKEADVLEKLPEGVIASAPVLLTRAKD